MTQEELDALLEAGVDLDDIDLGEEDTPAQNGESSEDASAVNESSDEDDAVYPPPADEKHKVVAQLDEVTKESDKKATEMMDVLEKVNNTIFEQKDKLSEVKSFLESQKSLFEKLVESFPHINTFKTALEDVEKNLQTVEELINTTDTMEEDVMNVMMIMQYQDIHRQKIERVINIMRALSKYMSKLFEGKIDDSERVKSAEHLHGDEGTGELVSDEDIEALIAQFGG